MDIVVFSVAVILLLAILIAAGFLIRRWRRNGYRFSLRGLLIAFVVVACGLFAITRFVVPIINHRWAIYNIDQYGQIAFDGDYETSDSPFQVSHKSFSRWRDADEVYVTNDSAARDLAIQLRNLPEVTQVSLGGGVTDVELKAVCELEQHPSLKSLQFAWAPVTNNGFSHIAKLPHLKNVFINTCPIGNPALEHLKSIKGLRMLGLIEEGPKANPNRFTEPGFAAIGQLQDLTLLRLIRHKISDASAEHLTKLKQLQTLHFSKCWISDEALAKIR